MEKPNFGNERFCSENLGTYTLAALWVYTGIFRSLATEFCFISIFDDLGFDLKMETVLEDAEYARRCEQPNNV